MSVDSIPVPPVPEVIETPDLSVPVYVDPIPAPVSKEESPTQPVTRKNKKKVKYKAEEVNGFGGI